MLGICYGMQAMGYLLGRPRGAGGAARVRPGRAPAPEPRAGCSTGVEPERDGPDRGVDEPRRHRDAAAPGLREPRRDRRTARSRRWPTTARRLFAVQFHPEVAHTPQGKTVLENFLDVCGRRAPTGRWPRSSTRRSTSIRPQVGRDRVLCALSGGVDSSVVAVADPPRGRRSAHVPLRRQRPAPEGRGRGRGAHLPGRLQDQPDPCRCNRAIPRASRGRHRSRGQAQEHRRRVHRGLRGRGAEARATSRGSPRARSIPT